MEKRKQTAEIPEKVLLIYQAVPQMLKEGADINTLKVSEITERAGIGKGTAYEYFSSKEELITRALLFYIEKKVNDIENISESQNSFPDKIHAVLDYVEQNFDDIRGFCMLVRIGTGSYEISEPLKNEYERMQETFDCHRMDHLIDRMIEQGRQEGILTQNNTFLCRMAFASQMMMYTAALLQQEKADLNVPETEKLKTFVYHALVKSLN
jgi:hypothetical protein|uniref:TetR/AcrR family transcriptional regulator n=1 Tax=Roseburia sp. TaxID=2049040 RepID=UPI003FEDF272